MVQKLAEAYPDAEQPVTVDMLTKKWVNLKDTFTNHRRQYEGACASGTGAVSEPTWKWWPYFKWLLTAHREQKTTSTTTFQQWQPQHLHNLVPQLQPVSPLLVPVNRRLLLLLVASHLQPPQLSRP